MASEGPHKQEFRIRELTTRSVLLFPTRAQIIRDIKEITLHPGPNQITIDGLAPTVDEHSIKVEGTGSATITDVTVDLLPNRELYEDIYPSDEEEEDDDDDDEDEFSEHKAEGMKVLNEKIKQFNITLLQEQEKINSGSTRLEICDRFANSVERSKVPPSDLEALVEAYRHEREKIFHEHEIATAAVEKVKEDIANVEKEKLKLAKELVKANQKVQKQKMKEREKKIRKKSEIKKEKLRIKKERESFWPKKVWRVTINLEPSSFTPTSSRRSSIDGDTIVNLATSTFHETPSAPLKVGEISLSLSYITYSANWSPRYDLTLSTIKNTGLLEYGAELTNTTSETWANAKVILSTSQTTFGGLSETIPTLHPWHVRLIKGGRLNTDSALFSAAELQAKQNEWSTSTRWDQIQKPRHEIFGYDLAASKETYMEAQKQKNKERDIQAQAMVQQSAPDAAPLFGQTIGYAAQSPRKSGGLLKGGLLKGSTARPMPLMAPQAHSGQSASLFGSAPPSRSHINQSVDKKTIQNADKEELFEDMGSGLFDNGPAGLPPNSLTFEEGAWEETGMTTTYDVPGLKTLTPSNSTTKHKIAKIEFKNIIFSHIVIGKLRQVAFLKARLRNMSKITLMKGPLGLTLDGSFLGQTNFPRCSAGETFSLPLGIDPGITVSYLKPTVRRSQSGIFSKEDSNVFTRTVTITNTKHNLACELTVLDQVTVSEDERLRIEVLSPRGLKVGGEAVGTGGAVGTSTAVVDGKGKGIARDARASVYGADGKMGDGVRGEKWGSAVATCKKGGEVAWNVKLNPGQGVKLVLEYEAAFPGGEMVIGV